MSAETQSASRRLGGEHRLQLDMLTAFRRAIAEESSRADVDELLDNLTEFTRVHFASEQTLMRLYQYPHMAQHTADHDDIAQGLQELHRAHSAERTEIATGTVDRLSEALRQHIVTSDKALEFFLERLGAGSV